MRSPRDAWPLDRTPPPLRVLASEIRPLLSGNWGGRAGGATRRLAAEKKSDSAELLPRDCYGPEISGRLFGSRRNLTFFDAGLRHTPLSIQFCSRGGSSTYMSRRLCGSEETFDTVGFRSAGVCELSRKRLSRRIGTTNRRQR